MKTIYFFFALFFLSQNLSAQTNDNTAKAKNGKWLLESFVSIDRSSIYNDYAYRDGWGSIVKKKINPLIFSQWISGSQNVSIEHEFY